MTMFPACDPCEFQVRVVLHQYVESWITIMKVVVLKYMDTVYGAKKRLLMALSWDSITW